jgi:mono/diheme cytochrome c family protein
MRRFIAVLIACLAGATLVRVTGIAQDRAAAPPTFNKDIAPILFDRCVTCHRPGEVAPMSLLSYGDARPWAASIKRMVQTRRMPPWPADPQFGEFKNNRRLSDEQVNAIAAWVDAGAPEGDGRPPAAPMFRDGWSSRMDRPPDQVIETPFTFEVPATGTVPTFAVWLKLPIRDERFVQAIELRPDTPRVVHHSSVTVGSLPSGTKLGRGAVWDGGPVLDGVPLYSDGRPFRAASAESFGKPLLFYVPGGGALQFPDGLAKRISPDQYIAWGLHFMTVGTPQSVKVRLGLWWAKKTVHHEIYTWTVNEKLVADGVEVARDRNGRSQMPHIPPRAENWPMTGVLQVKEDITLYALWPHMHFRGKDMTFVLTTPDGKQETLLAVPRYDPNWQLVYELTKPRKIKARSTITAYGHFDNSPANTQNPDPNEDVVFGEQANNEMYIPFLEVTVDDEDLRFQRLQEQLR